MRISTILNLYIQNCTRCRTGSDFSIVFDPYNGTLFLNTLIYHRYSDRILFGLNEVFYF